MSAISRLYHVADSFNLRKIQAQDKSNPAATELRNFRSSYNTKVFNVAANPTLPSQNGVQRDYDVQISEMEYRILRENVMNEANSLIEEPQAYYGFKINSDIANNLIRNCNALIRESQQVFVGETDASKMTQVFKLFNDLSFLYNENVADIKKDLIFKQTFHAKLIQIEILFEKIKDRFQGWKGLTAYRFSSFKTSFEFSPSYIIEILNNLIYVLKEMFEIKSTAEYLADSDFNEYVNRGQLEIQPLDGVVDSAALVESDAFRREEEARLEDSKHRIRAAHTEYGDGVEEMYDEKPGVPEFRDAVEDDEADETAPLLPGEVHTLGEAASGVSTDGMPLTPSVMKLEDYTTPVPAARTARVIKKTKKDFPSLDGLEKPSEITKVFNDYVNNDILGFKTEYKIELRLILDGLLTQYKTGSTMPPKIIKAAEPKFKLQENFVTRVQSSGGNIVPLISSSDVDDIFEVYAKSAGEASIETYETAINIIKTKYVDFDFNKIYKPVATPVAEVVDTPKKKPSRKVVPKPPATEEELKQLTKFLTTMPTKPATRSATSMLPPLTPGVAAPGVVPIPGGMPPPPPKVITVVPTTGQRRSSRTKQRK